jgi:carbonic anhydrase/acetyltransferase-like protein (isoleucine patch superfamily)
MPSGLILPYRGLLPTIAEDAWIAPNATVIGDTVIGAGSSVWFGCVLRGDSAPIRIGRGVNIQDGTIVHVSGKRGGTTIGDEVSIGHLALIHACTLEPGCFIGMSAVVMDGAVVESGAMVGAGALVPPGKRVARGELWTGRPARFARQLTERDFEMFRDVAGGYVRLGEEYRTALRPA